jgi:hypothetical protein
MPRPKKKEIDTSKSSILSLLQEVYNELVEQRNTALRVQNKMLAFLKDPEDMTLIGPVLEKQQKIINDVVEKKLTLFITTNVFGINSKPAVFNNAWPSEDACAAFASKNEALNTPLSATKFQSKLPSACLLNHLATSLLAIFSFERYFSILNGNSLSTESIFIFAEAAIILSILESL